jgi:hypothetical protein
LFKDAGISFGEGGNRPAGEGGKYIKFATIEDGLKAYNIILTQMGDDVYKRLFRWSAGGDEKTPEATKIANKTAYANGLMAAAGIPPGTKFSDLNTDQMAKLQQAQIRRESPGLAAVLASPEFQTSSKPAEYSPETDKNLEAVSQNANGVNYLDKTTNQILTSQQAMDKYGQPAQAGVDPMSSGYSEQQKNLMQAMKDQKITMSNMDDK